MAEQLHRGTRAVQRLLEYAPAGGALALWVRHVDAPEADAGAPAWTDGRTLFYAPGFEDLPLPLQTGWVAHEVLHVALRHVPRADALRARLGDVDPALWNLCADAVVNSALAHLGWLSLPAGAATLESVLERVLGVVLGPEAALLQWDVERLYRALDDRREGGRDGRRSATARALAARQPADLRAGSHPEDPPEAEAEATREWSERLQRAHAGDGAHSLLRTLLADLPRVRTPWEQVLRTQAAHALSRRAGLSWSRPTRSWIANQGRAGPGCRLPWEPGRTHTSEVPRLVLVVDNSGSIEEALLRRFARELQALSRRLEAALVVVIGDRQVRAVRRYEPGRADLSDLAAPGGGGTDFEPLLAEAQRHAPDLIVVLTDLEGPAGPPPRCAVLWAVTEAHAGAPVPFGRRLVMD